MTAKAPTESQIQSSFVYWTRLNLRKHPDLRLGFSVPNGAWARNIKLAMKLKREGMRPGVPDWMLPVKSWQWIGLAIEFKRPGSGKLSKEQAEYHQLLKDQGWMVEVCTDWKVAAGIVSEYLK